MAKTAILAVRIVGDATSGAKAIDDAGGAADRLFGKIKGGAVIAGAALAGAVAGAVAFGADAVSAAGDLEQSIGAVDTVFKGSAGQMHDWAQSAAQDVGLTRNEFNELGTLIGTQLKNGGTAMDELAPKTNNLIGLGADLSSMFGGTTADAVSALSSALKGERDPIERYGVALNQASIDAKAAELGFEKLGGTLSTEAQQAATIALIMEQTADATGNFARESDTLQGKQQRLSAELENTKAAIGTALLPVVVGALDVFANRFLPVITGAADTFIGFVESLDLGDSFTNLVSGVEEFVSGVYTHLEPFIPTIESMFGTVREIIGSVGEIIGSTITLIQEQIQLFIGLVTEAWALWGDDITATASAAWTFITEGVIGPALELIKSIIATATAIIRGDWSAAWTGIKNIVSNLWDLISGIVSHGVELIKSAVSSGMNIVRDLWSGAWSTVKDLAGTAWDAIVAGVESGIGRVTDWFGRLPGQITGALSGLSSTMRRMGVNALQGFINGARSMANRLIEAVLGPIRRAVERAERFLGIASPSKLFARIGGFTGQGFVDGLLGTTTQIEKAAGDMVSAAIPKRLPALGRLTAAGGHHSAGGISITVNGALDPNAVARQIRDLLNHDARIRGSVHLAGTVIP